MSDRSKIRTEIDFLTVLEKGEAVTQSALSRQVSVSVGLMNTLIKRAVRKGYVKVKLAPRKRYIYYLTPKGFVEKSRLVAEYLESSLSFFGLAKQEYEAIFTRAMACWARRCLLVGKGELAEIAVLANIEAKIGILNILDWDIETDEQRNKPALNDGVIKASDILVITESRHPQRAFIWAARNYPDHEVLVPPFLRLLLEQTPPATSEENL